MHSRRSYFRTGLYKAALPLITGQEAAGTVAAVSSGAKTDLQAGDKVVYLHGHTYAAYTAVPVAKVVRIPSNVSTEQAAASLMQGLTALTLIREAAGLHPTAMLGLGQGLWVLVHAASGGVGTQLVQMLAAVGAKVIGTAGGPDKCELARRNGAQWVIDSRSENLAARVKEITSGHGADVIFDGVGKATFDIDLDVIALKGHLVMFGNAVSLRRPPAAREVALILVCRSRAPCHLLISCAWGPRTSNWCVRSCSTISPHGRIWSHIPRNSSIWSPAPR